MPRNALGRGLSALIREPAPLPPEPKTAPQTEISSVPAAGTPVHVDIDLIDPNPYQPRTQFKTEALEELAQSIRANGIIQPLVLRPTGRRYQLIAGERRWRAAQRAGLMRVPAILKDIPENRALEITLVENLQREDLNPIEQARAFERLMTEFQLTQEEIAERTGKDRATIANTLRLLKLEKSIQELVEEGRLTAGHARALLAIADPKLRSSLAQRAARGMLTVRKIERLASVSQRTQRKEATAPEQADPNLRAALEELTRHLGTRVHIKLPSRGKPGRIVLEYYDERQLQGLYERLMRT
ncbi:MAG: ParB/RepB/Spo0J family partition protein [Acidobacteriia bacterium]|jgi:ParB family chromosome partitioning protein|nr:ParB/RepB/Spo0J family partition protein [Terriglobia bacterium]